jgi:fatty-acyl-CoA synthase
MGKDYIRLAEKLDVKYVRVLISPNIRQEPVDTDEAALRMRILCDYAKKHGVTVLVETNGVLADSDVMLKFIESISRENVGVLWDIHHPYRFFGEAPEDTYGKLKPYIKHVHVKDSVMQDDTVIYKIMGKGDIPVRKCLDLLRQGGYDGFVSLEWMKRWNPVLEEPGLVFPHFMEYMKDGI